MALLAQQADDKEGALRIAREMLETTPNDPRALVLYADLLRDDERFPEAVQVLNRAIGGMSEAEAGWSMFYVRGVAEERAGDWPTAEADLKHALKLKPDEPQTLNYLGYAWADRGEHLKEALAMLEKAASLAPRSGAIVDSLGWARYRVHQYRDATRDLETAVMLEPSDPEVNSHLGDAYWRVGRQLEARFQWNRVLTLAPDAKTKAATEIKLAKGLSPEPAEPAVKP
jgi:Flp pilus assembly protein TadD